MLQIEYLWIMVQFMLSDVNLRDLTNQNLFIFTAAGVVPCGGRKKSPSTSS